MLLLFVSDTVVLQFPRQPCVGQKTNPESKQEM
jgi:hypothetical protein